MSKKLLLFTFMTVLFSAQTLGTEVVIGNFSQGDTSAWKEKTFVGKTQYSIVQHDGIQVLQAISNASASAFYKTVNIDLEKTPYLNWSWQVENIYPNTDPTRKRGDDYPARIYVVLEGFWPWNTLALNYVFSNNNEPIASSWDNPFTSNARMIVINSNLDNLHKMKNFKVNVKTDFKKYFNEDVDNIDGIAIMSDSDNTKLSSKAYFGNIYFTNN